MARQTGQTRQTLKKRPTWEKRFLEALAETGIVRDACAAARVGRATVYEHRRDRSDFAGRWKQAEDEACDMLVNEARRRAYEGTLKPVFYQGAQCGQIREYSDTLLMFIIKARRPEEYREEAMTPRRIIAVFERMVEIIQAEVGEADARRVANRFEREIVGSMANGHGAAPVDTDGER